MTLGIALVGAGRMGRTHARIVAEHPAAELRVVVDPDEQAGRAVTQQWGGRWTPTVDGALTDDALDGWIVAVPDRLHVDVTLAILATGRTVLLEKPLADTHERALRIAAAAPPDRLAVGHVLRHDRRFQAAAQQVASGVLGACVHVRASRLVPRAVGVANRGASPIYMYQGVHDVDLVQWVTGQRISAVCAATTAAILPRLDVPGDDVALVLLRLASGAIGMLEISWALPDRPAAALHGNFNVYGTDGALTIDVAEQGLGLVTANGFSLPDVTLAYELSGRLQGALLDQFEHFLAMTRGEQPASMPVADAVAAVAVLDAIGASLESGTWAAVREVPDER